MVQVETISESAIVSMADPVKPSSLTRYYILLLLTLLPSDYFGPTARVLREGGARPAVPLMLVGSCWIVYRHWRWFLVHTLPFWRHILFLFTAVLFLGTVAFGINIALGVSYWDGARSPIGQFASQAALFALVAPVLVTHAWLFSQPGVEETTIAMLPKAVGVQLAVIAIQAAGIFTEDTFPLVYFRGEVRRVTPTGLMTEPSYVGVMAAMYGLPLLLCMPRHKQRYRLLGCLLLAVALWVGGKTLVPALLAGIIGYAYQARARIFSVRSVLAVGSITAFGYYITVSRATLDLRDNLSSAMRFGSTLLAYNVAKEGYGLYGIGFGQFHFVYRPKYAPWFLTYSTEAIAAFTRSANIRASTYNLPIRIIDETGILGLLLLLLFLAMLFRRSRLYDTRLQRIGAVIAAASLGFLMTQDPYFFPSFVCGAAMMAVSAIPIAQDVA